MSFFRSQTINYYKIVLPRDSAWQIMNDFGQRGILSIVPNNKMDLKRPYLTQIRSCQDALHKVDKLEKILQNRKILPINDSFQEQAYDELFLMWDNMYEQNRHNSAPILYDFISQVNFSWGYYQDLEKRQGEIHKKLKQNRQELAMIQAGYYLYGQQFFNNQKEDQIIESEEEKSIDIESDQYFYSNKKLNFNFTCGVIEGQSMQRFSKTIFRLTRGNSMVSFVSFTDIFEEIFEEQEGKQVFYILLPPQKSKYIQKKVAKLVQSFSLKNKYLSSRHFSFEKTKRGIMENCQETIHLQQMTRQEINSFLRKYSAPMQESKYFRRHQYRKKYIQKEKSLYQNLSYMDVSSYMLHCSAYARNADVNQMNEAFRNINQVQGIPTGQAFQCPPEKYPTYYKVNDYTRSAQEIVETYGFPRYKEVNPSFFTVITFPFLFGVMFGDIAHGFIFFCFGLYLTFFKDSIDNQILRTLLPHRYMIVLMGFFGTYCGFIYNDFLSISLNLFGSCFNPQGITPNTVMTPTSSECIYPFGLDPAWSISSNSMAFTNSLKMKLSVIIAVIHMLLGIFMKAVNSLHFRKKIDFFFEFLPQLIFMVFLFGYMDFLIIYKWLKPWGVGNKHAPMVITTMINMPLKMGKTVDCCGGQPMWGKYGSTSQDHIQMVLLLCSLICIPLMLFPKPIYELYCRDKQKQKEDFEEQYKRVSQDFEEQQDNELIDQFQAYKELEMDLQEPDCSQIFVHQLIQTIEYVLGCISNTASYLRLWALSLAHSQLSQVFFDKLVKGSIMKGKQGIPFMIIGFIFLAGATFGILLCMDSMQCFLHTLRLHWVQFQNKFYKGDGVAFVPFSFRNRLKSDKNQL